MTTVLARALARTAAATAAIVVGLGSAYAQSGEVNVYTYREGKLIQPLFDAFTKASGVKVNVISASSGLEQRIKTEGANSPADVCSPSISPDRGGRSGRHHPTDQVRRARQARCAAIPRS